MTTSLAADKAIDKRFEKRRALGRGLDSLLPSGPRVVGGSGTIWGFARGAWSGGAWGFCGGDSVGFD